MPEVCPIAPRLLSVEGAAQYLSLSAWTIRDYVVRGVLHPVRLPAVNGHGETRRILLDRRELDALIDGRAEAARGAHA